MELLNTAGRPIDFKVLSNAPWINVEPASGTFSGPSQLLTVTVDATSSDLSRHGSLAINTTAGHRTVDVNRAIEFDGQYAGEVKWTTPFQMMASGLELHLFRSATSGTLTGYIADDSSLLFPVKAGVSANHTPDGEITLQFEMLSPPGASGNSRQTNAIRRSLLLHGHVDAAGDIVGTVVERIAGLHFESDVELGGDFRLARVGPPLAGQASAPPDVALIAPPSPFTTSQTSYCQSICPQSQAPLCIDDLGRAKAFLVESTQLYRSFQAAADVDGHSPFTTAAAAACTGDACINELYLRCAQAIYIHHLEANPQSESAFTGLMDALEVLADTSIFLGNERLTEGFEAWKHTSGIQDELPLFQAAIEHFTHGSHARSVAQPLGMLDTYTLGVVHRHARPELLRSFPTAILNELGDASPRAAFEHLRRQALAVAGAVRAGTELAERQHRLGAIDDAIQLTRSTALQGFLDAAALGQLFAKAGATSTTVAELDVLHSELARVAQKSEDLKSGRNPAGYLPSYVPLLYSGTLAHRSNFENIYQATTSAEVRGAAESAEASVENLGRTFEASLSQFESQRLEQTTQYEVQFLDLCGTLDLQQCGMRAGMIFNAQSELKQARLRFKSVQQRIADIEREIEIERNRLAQQTSLIEAEIEAIHADGRRTNALHDQRQVLNRINAVGSFLDSALSAITTLNPAGVVSSATGAVTSEFAFKIDKEEAALEEAKKVRYESRTRDSIGIDSAAFVETKRLETHTLLIEAAIAYEGYIQAAANIQMHNQRIQALNRHRHQAVRLNARDAYRSLQHRVYVDHLGIKAREAILRYLRWAHLSTRALEYELNVSYDSRELWKSRSATDISEYLNKLVEFHRIGQSLPPEQVTTDIISIRDLLVDSESPVSDPVTGKQYSQRDRFRHYISKPDNRDSNGNLRLTFMTHRPDKPVFSRAVCSDRIQSIRINLIGDNLGAGVSNAYVRLSQGGTSFLRNCGQQGESLTSYNLLGSQQEPRVARIQAGVNAPMQGRDLAPNTDHLHTALLAGPWELVVDQRPDIEPSNASLDLSQLDDIELIIEHKSYTLQ